MVDSIFLKGQLLFPAWNMNSNVEIILNDVQLKVCQLSQTYGIEVQKLWNLLLPLTYDTKILICASDHQK